MLVIGSLQTHHATMIDICPILTAAMGEGGGMIPMAVEVTDVSDDTKCGDRDKEGTYSVHEYSNTIPSNPMSDRGQLLLEVTDVTDNSGE